MKEKVKTLRRINREKKLKENRKSDRGDNSENRRQSLKKT